MKKDYHQYIFDFENNTVRGDFEGAYAHCGDVWPSQHMTSTPKHQLILNAAKDRGDNVSLLDVGCGYGDFVYFLRSRGIDAKGCDISRTAIQKGIERFGLSGMLHEHDFLSGGFFPEHSFDIVLCLGVFQYILDKMQSGLAALKRLLKPHGLLVLSAFIPPEPIGKEHIPDYSAFYDAVKKHFIIDECLIIYKQEDVRSGKPLNECRDDLVLFCTNTLPKASSADKE
ncbi:MAG: class I SAM-dependent methyltransferase [Candidatus Aureabacteria bacterium]|nr:class I SAM-dependent methyltransferase [Candidatus Auribacterota bacterium]